MKTPADYACAQLCFKFKSDKNEMFDFEKTFADALAKENLAEKTPVLLQTLNPLEGTVSDMILKRIAGAGMSYVDLTKTFQEKGSGLGKCCHRRISRRRSLL